MKKMNLKKYEKLRKRFENKPIEWLELYIRPYNICKNNHVSYLYQLIDRPIEKIHSHNNAKIFPPIVNSLKEKTGIDFAFIKENSKFPIERFRIIPSFVLDMKLKAESGDAEAMFEYSEYLQKFQSLQGAHEWHTKAALAGNSKAMVEEGNFILYGWIEGSLEDAFDYFRKVAELGERKVFSDLGDCFLYGLGCDQDFQKARECYKKASWWKHRKIIKQLSKKDFHLEIDGEKVLEKIREFYN